MLRRHKSMEDLTELVKATRERDEEIRAGRLFPYEDRIVLVSEKDEKTPGVS